MTAPRAEPIGTGEHPVPVHIADYQIQRALGYGNNGRVYLARPPRRLGISDEFVAVKVLDGPCPEPTYELMLEELRAVSGQDSPYLARVFEAGLDGLAFFYAMEYAALGSLAAPGRPLRQSEVLLAVSHAASAAHVLHEAGIAHAAIKPQNVLIGSRCALLADVGLSRHLRPGLTMTGVATSGSVEFLDPLILTGGSPSRSSEVWSLGATLHRALAGVGLYGELSDIQPLLAIREVMSGQPSMADGLSLETSTLIRECLDSPERRLPTAKAVAQRLTDLVRGGPGVLSGG